MSQPRQLDHPLYHLLHNDDVKGFNAQKPKGVEVDLSGGDFRGLDLRNMDTDAVNFNDAYFRGADLRGLDFRRDSHVGQLRHSPALSHQVAHFERRREALRPLAATLSGRHANVNLSPARMEAR